MCSASWKINCWETQKGDLLWLFCKHNPRTRSLFSAIQWFSFLQSCIVTFKTSEPYLWGNCPNARNPPQWPSYNEVHPQKDGQELKSTCLQRLCDRELSRSPEWRNWPGWSGVGTLPRCQTFISTTSAFVICKALCDFGVMHRRQPAGHALTSSSSQGWLWWWWCLATEIQSMWWLFHPTYRFTSCQDVIHLAENNLWEAMPAVERLRAGQGAPMGRDDLVLYRLLLKREGK